ncbi:hypothetical protein CAL7716_004150 [Calothrix sp. PCC 7716]|nr:hypothetical protein CAL7716_004150 [Calothrix sp. PCC 7716]
MNNNTPRQKILIVSAIPHGLRLDKEVREIGEAIRRSVKRDLYDIKVRNALRTQDIRRALAEEKPQIVHFCGHGKEDGSLVLEDEMGNFKPVVIEALARLFKLHADCIKCLVINACHSEKTAEAIVTHIEYVIGMNQEITDKAAILFSQGFYDALGYEIENKENIFLRAFEEGKLAIHLDGTCEQNIPVFKNKSDLVKKLAKSSEEIGDSIDFFARRFAKAFPGIRGIKLFNSSSESQQRIATLLATPIIFNNYCPIWWWRGFQNMHIDYFESLDDDTFLLGKTDEIRINRIAAFNSGIDYQCFVYVEAKAMQATGLYSYRTREFITDTQQKMGFCREEFGIYDNQHLITRYEYDDGYCIINNKLTDMERNKTKLRVRYLTPYNFIIAPHDSPINNYNFDVTFEKIMNEMLQGRSSIETLTEAILKLPRNKKIS